MREYDHTEPRVDYSYCNQQNTSEPGVDNRAVEIRLRCPRISSFKWCLKLYSLVLGGLGLFLSFFWVCFQLYVLSQTNNYELRLQRYLDIFLGLLLLLSLIFLLYGGYSESQIWIITFIIISLGVVLSYWGSYFYNSYVGQDYSDYEQQSEEVGCILTLVYFLLLLPLLLLYRSLEKEDTTQRRDVTQLCGRTLPPKYDEAILRN